MNNKDVKYLLRKEAENIKINNSFYDSAYAQSINSYSENSQYKNYQKKNKLLWLKFSAAICAVCVVIAFVILAPTIFFDNKVDASLTIDINPAIAIDLNKNNKVVNVTSSNEEGKQIIENLKLKRLDYEKAVELIIDKAIDKNYIDQNSEENAVLFSYVSPSVQKQEAILNRVKEITVKKCENRGINVKKDNIIVEESKREQVEQAKEYNISPAKYRLIERAYQQYDGTLSKEEFFEEYKDKSIRELNEFIKEKQNKRGKQK